MKQIKDYVWPEEDYTNKIHAAVRDTFRSSPLVPFTYPQLRDLLTNKFPWLVLDEDDKKPWLVPNKDKKKQLLSRIVKTAIKKFTQLGLIKECTSKLATEQQWIWAEHLNELGVYRNLTSPLEVAQTEDAINSCLNRALSDRELNKLNDFNERRNKKNS